MSARTILLGLVALAVVAGSAGLVVANASAILNRLTSRDGYTIDADRAYGPLPRQKLDVYTPEHAEDAAVVVFFYGGGWNKGEKDRDLFVGQSLASAGFIVVIPDYRVYADVVFPAFVEDAAKAVGYVRETLKTPDGTPRPLFLAGHSAGAHIAALLNLDERYLAAAGVPKGAISGVVGLSGPYDFLPLKEDIYKAIFPEPIRAESQPINFVDGNEAPMLLITGDADTTVRPRNTARLADAIAASGGDVSVKSYPGVSHLGTVAALATATFWRKPDVRAAMIDFFRERLSASTAPAADRVQKKPLLQ
jgi:acetyl esterase/lipase